jgi:hypothetical protein
VNRVDLAADLDGEVRDLIDVAVLADPVLEFVLLLVLQVLGSGPQLPQSLPERLDPAECQSVSHFRCPPKVRFRLSALMTGSS